MKKSSLADFSLLIVAFIWGTTFVLVQNAISFLEPLTFNGIRFFLAGLFLSIWIILFHRKQLKQIDKKIVLSGMFIGFWLFCGYALQTFGLLYTTTSKAGFITGLSVVLVPVFALVLLKQHISKHALFGIVAATIGLYLLTMGDKLSISNGDLLIFLCAISFALHIVLTGKYTNLFPSLLLTVVQIVTVALLCIISSFLFENWQNAFSLQYIGNPKVLLALLITSIFATAIAFLIQTSLQKYTSPSRVALIFAMEPVFAAIAGYLFANERLTMIALFGCVCIFSGMIYAELPGKKEEKQEPTG